MENGDNLIINKSNYLKQLKFLFSHSNNLTEIIYILGNNTCDLDSAICSYLLSIALNIQSETIIFDNEQNPKLNLNSSKLYLPVLNIERGTLPYRIDVKYAFDKYGIEENDFWYISDEYLTKENLFQYSNFISDKNENNIKSSIILVDHNLLINKLNYLSNFVIGIYDHHVITNYNNNYQNLYLINIRIPIGSCSTIILSEFYMKNFPLKLVSPLFALTALLIDCRNFSKDYYGNRWVDLDKEVFNKIKSEIKDDNINFNDYYKEINGVKHDVEKNLKYGFEPLLRKVQKFYEFNTFKIIWSAFYISYYDIRDKIGEEEMLNKMLEYYKNKDEKEIKKILFVTNSPIDSNKELYTIFNPIEIQKEFDDFKDEIENKDNFYSMEKKFFKNKGIVYYFVLNHVYTRKIVEPILQKICFKIKNI